MKKELMPEDKRLLTLEELLRYAQKGLLNFLQREYPNLKGDSKKDWLQGQMNQLENEFNTPMALLNREAQLVKADEHTQVNMIDWNPHLTGG